MVKVMEFRDVSHINDYLKNRGKIVPQFEIIPVERRFINPNTKLLTSCITYVLVLNEV